jgi:hypothetical protein
VTEHDFLVTLAGHWPAVLAELDPDDARRFTELVGQVRSAATSEEADDACYELRQLAHKLPRGHPVRTAASSERYATGPAVIDLADIAAVLGDLDLQLRPDDDDDPDAWLLAAPSLSEQDVRAFGVAPERAGLLRLPGKDQDSRPRWPAFQFDADGRPVPVVLAVNELLGASADPWGVADWWLGENAWLEAVPADLIGRVADAVLLAAARAVRWEE